MKTFELVEAYKKNGFLPFPLAPQSKVPPKGSSLDTIDQDWKFQDGSNIGVFPGSRNGLVVIDCDNETSQIIVSGRLQEMGLLENTTAVRTPRKHGQHFWLRVLDVPNGIQCSFNLPKDIGAGEIRLRRNNYVAAPGSVLPEGEYRFERGGIEEFVNQPVVVWQDLAWLLPPSAEKGTTGRAASRNFNIGEILALPVRLIFRPNPEMLRLLSMLENWEKDQPINWVKDRKTGEVKVYKSTSNAEAAVVSSLILCGWKFEQIEAKFEHIQPVHYREHANPCAYLAHVYNSAIMRLSESETRQKIEDAYRAVLSSPWSGRTGGTDQRVLLAVLAKAWQFKTMQPTASHREISEHAGIAVKTVDDAVERLQRNGFLRRLVTQKKDDTSWYDISPTQNVNQVHINKTPYPVISVYQTDTTLTTGDLWSKQYLGGSAFLMYSHLSDSPLKLDVLVQLTGKSRNTLIANGKKLEQHGLAISTRKYEWIRGDARLEEVAVRIGAVERAKQRRKAHAKERIARKNRQVNYRKTEENLRNEQEGWIDNIGTGEAAD